MSSEETCVVLYFVDKVDVYNKTLVYLYELLGMGKYDVGRGTVAQGVDSGVRTDNLPYFLRKVISEVSYVVGFEGKMLIGGVYNEYRQACSVGICCHRSYVAKPVLVIAVHDGTEVGSLYGLEQIVECLPAYSIEHVFVVACIEYNLCVIREYVLEG